MTKDDFLDSMGSTEEEMIELVKDSDSYAKFLASLPYSVNEFMEVVAGDFYKSVKQRPFSK